MSRIDEKYRRLQAEGLDLGAALHPSEEDAGFGGVVRRYEHGHIYWHPVMGREAYEVHGGILQRYLDLGGPGESSDGRRILGFPLSDETLTLDGQFPVSHFEWGAIYWKHGAGQINGSIFNHWRGLGAELGPLGYPVSAPRSLLGGEVCFFECGCLWAADTDAPVRIDLVGPQIGRPAMVDLGGGGLEAAMGLRTTAPFLTQANAIASTKSIWDDRLVLRRVGASTTHDDIPLSPGADQGTADADAYLVPLALREGRRLQDRALYDLYFVDVDGTAVRIAPHCVYARDSWSDFGLIHITDLHVAARNDLIKAQLDAHPRTGQPHGGFNNSNDNLRDAIKYANRLHAAGVCDAIMATGDLVDYIFEDQDTFREGPGNFGLLHAILCGESTYADGSPAEELSVPIFTCLGNHDFRTNGSPLVFNVSLGAEDFIEDTPILGRVFSALGDGLRLLPGGRYIARSADVLTSWIKTVDNHSTFNLTKDEAHVVSGGVMALGGVPAFKTYSGEEALKLVEVNDAMRARRGYYYKYINRQPFYEVVFGENRLVMLDTGWDDGIVTGTWDAAAAYLGLSGTAAEEFAHARPQSVGLSPEQIDLLKRASNAAASGCLMVGMHATPFDINGHEYAHYFRETEHASSDPVQTNGFLFRRTSLRSPELLNLGRDAWPRTATDHFHMGTRGELLGPFLINGIATGCNEELLMTCAGSPDSPRGVDLVLFGHVHRHVEYRIEYDEADGRMRFFHDYYFENPHEYYATEEAIGSDPHSSRTVRVFVDSPEAVGPPIEVRDDGAGEPFGVIFDKEWRRGTPKNESTLNQAGDKRGWFEAHRPVFAQTAALGPIDKLQRPVQDGERPSPAFQGLRVILVRDDVVASVNHVAMADIRTQSTARFVLTPVLGPIVVRPA